MFVRVPHQHFAGVARGIVDADHLDDDQAGAALRPRALIGDQILAGRAVTAEVGIMAGGEDAVAQLQRLDAIGREEIGKARAHAVQASTRRAMNASQAASSLSATNSSGLWA